jgi:hypothetical protein
MTREEIREQAIADSARTRVEQGLPAQVGAENPDELARVAAVLRQGLDTSAAPGEGRAA